jgi:outer membrane murein-binding lipoprotein Lpp
MSEAIIVALITGGLSLVGVVITCLATAKKNETSMKVSQAVTDTKIDELTREVRQHNNFAQRMPVVEEQIKVINNRIKDLEGYHKPTN